MITIIHGQNIVASREFLLGLIDKNRQGGKKIIRLEKNDQTVENASQILGGTDLFGAQNTLLLENYLKLKALQKANTFQEFLNKSNSEIIIWEEDQRSPSALALFPTAKVFEFKLPPTVFKFLDGLRPGSPKNNVALHRQALAGSAAEMIFSLLARRFVDLSFPPAKAADWQKARLNAQARLFPKEKLTKAISDLLTIDLTQKTSSSPLSLSHELELFLLNL
jgi:hypothetical protein